MALFAMLDIKLRFILFPDFFGVAHIFEIDIYNLATAFIASFVFYYLVVFIPEKQKQLLYQDYVRNKINEIFRDSSWLVSQFQYNDDSKKDQFRSYDYDELKKIIDKINPGEVGSLIINTTQGNYRLTIWENICNTKNVVMNNINMLSVRTPSFDPNLTKYLMEIEDCALFRVIHQAGMINHCANLDFISVYFIDYLKLLSKMGKYANKKYGAFLFENMFNKKTKS